MHITRVRELPSAWPRFPERAFTGIALATLTMAAVVRLHVDPSAPLWLDESWTGAIAAQPSLAALAEQVRDDVNAPAYYALIWAWAKAFGVSDVALRVPSMALGLITPAVAWFCLRSSRPVVALSWAVLLAVWPPGVNQSGDARCYALLSCAAVATTLAHLRLLESPTFRRTLVWAAFAAFMTLVHYQAGLLAAAQGAAFLALHRGRALRFWPAALAFAPALAWMAWHAPRLAAYARTDVAWFDLLRIADLPLALAVLTGGPLILISLVVALSAGAASKLGRGDDVRGPADAALWCAAGAALAAAAACVAVGFVRPSFTFRYLTPFAPGALLLAAACVARVGRSPYLPSALFLVGPLLTATVVLEPDAPLAKRLYNFEVASAWLAEAGPSHLAFFWDNPMARVESRSQLDAVGGFFLRRAGSPLQVDPVVAAVGSASAPAPAPEDMNDAVLRAAGPDGAVLWLYDAGIHDTSAHDHPPRLASLDPGLECRDFGRSNIGVVACRRPRR